MTLRLLLFTLLLSPLALASSAASTGLAAADVAPDTLRDDPITRTLDQPDVPVSLTAYEADYDGVRLFQADGIRHQVNFLNTSDRDVVAVKVRFVMFSVFYDVIDEVGEVVLDRLAAGTSDDDAWTNDPPNASTFYVGAAYVDKVRFDNGDIWEANADNIEKQLARIEEGEIEE